MTNPWIFRTTLESGSDNLLKDLEEGDGKIKIKMVDPDAFEVGVNVATTPGKVIFWNDLMELLQFNPTTGHLDHDQGRRLIPCLFGSYCAYRFDSRQVVRHGA